MPRRQCARPRGGGTAAAGSSSARPPPGEAVAARREAFHDALGAMAPPSLSPVRSAVGFFRMALSERHDIPRMPSCAASYRLRLKVGKNLSLQCKATLCLSLALPYI